MDGRCGTCRHWRDDERWREGERFRRCHLLPATGDDDWRRTDEEWDSPDYDKPEDEIIMARLHPMLHAYTQDASSYHSALMTDAEFGCVHWEATDG